MEARDGVYHDADEGEVEVGHPGQALGVAESRVRVMTGQDVPEETDALALDVSVLLGQSVVEVGQAETHQEMLAAELRAELRPGGPVPHHGGYEGGGGVY